MIEKTKEKLKKLHLPGMARFFDQHQKPSLINHGMTPEEFVSAMVECEWEDRYNRKIIRLNKDAGFRQQAFIPDIDVSASRGIDRALINKLSSFEWIKKGHNVLITGATGSGKSFIACALGNGACNNGYKTIYFTASKLFRKIRESKLDMSVSRFLSKLSKHDLLIIDDFGLEPFDGDGCRYLYEIMEERYNSTSTIISTQYPVDLWKKFITDLTIADAIMDRLIHNAYRINLEAGEKSRRAGMIID